MTFALIVCLECSNEYIQQLDPWGNFYPINTYMCENCSSKKIYKKELEDEEAHGMTDTHNVRKSYS